MEIKEIFKNIGFQEQEIIIYLYLLRNGPSTQQEISDNAQIIRQTVYDLVSKMLTKGYVSLSREGKKKIYRTVSPWILLKNLKEKQDEFKKIIPSLEKEEKIKETIYSESFIGMKGLKNLFNLSLEQKEPILWIANQKEHDIIFKDFYWDNYAIKRIDKKIPLKLLIEPPDAEQRYKTERENFREVKTNSFLKETSSSIALFGENSILYTIKEDSLFGVYIKNKEIKELLEKTFLNLWGNSKA